MKIQVFLLLAAATLLSNCGKPDEPAPAPTTQTPSQTPAQLPNAAVPTSGHLVSITQGVDLAQVKNQDMIHPQFSLTPPDIAAPIILGAVENDEKKTGSPVVIKKVNGSWKIVELTEAGRSEWVYVGLCPPRKEIWGVLDLATAERAESLTMLRSTDEGATWQFFSAVKKPIADAEYAGFSMDQRGIGRLSMHLEEDTGPVLHGYYHYATTDGGKTWTGPTFEGDDVTDADPLKDVDSLQDALKSAETTPAQ